VQCKHIVLVSKAKHSLTSQVKIRGYQSSKDSSTVNDAEMRNFSTAECGKAIRGSLRNVPHLIFCKLPLDNFPQSAFRKIPAPRPQDSDHSGRGGSSVEPGGWIVGRGRCQVTGEVLWWRSCSEGVNCCRLAPAPTTRRRPATTRTTAAAGWVVAGWCAGGANAIVDSDAISIRESRPAEPDYKPSSSAPLHRPICHGNGCLVTFR